MLVISEEADKLESALDGVLEHLPPLSDSRLELHARCAEKYDTRKALRPHLND